MNYHLEVFYIVRSIVAGSESNCQLNDLIVLLKECFYIVSKFIGLIR